MLVTSWQVNSQQFSAVSYFPERANGYLILDNKIYSDTVNWSIKFLDQDYDSSTNSYVYTEIQTFDLYGLNYMRIESEFMKDSIYIEIKGFDEQRRTVVFDGPLAICTGCQSTIECTYGCVGTTYAYGLPLYQYDNGTTKFGMTLINPSNGSHPHYYQWIDGGDWNTFTAGTSPEYYGLGSNNGGWFPPSFYGDLVIEIFPQINQYFYDAQNNLCTSGTVYGVAKNYGPWRNAHGGLVSNNLANQSGHCGLQFSYAQNLINNNTGQFTTYNVPFLSCNGETIDGFNEPPLPVADPMNNDYEPCIINVEDVGFDEDGFYIVLGYVGDCLAGAMNSNVNGFTWPEDLHAITYKPYNITEENQVVQLTESDLFDENGAFIGPSVSFLPGLNYMSFLFKDMSYSSLFFETEDTINSSLQDKDFLTVTAYPVPIQENSFSLDMLASASVSFEYTLMDNQFNVIFTKNYRIAKGNDVTDRIEVVNGIPSGILYNKFVFEDNSQFVFQTVK